MGIPHPRPLWSPMVVFLLGLLVTDDCVAETRQHGIDGVMGEPLGVSGPSANILLTILSTPKYITLCVPVGTVGSAYPGFHSLNQQNRIYFSLLNCN